MANKFLVMFMLGMGLTYGQSVTVTTTLDAAPFVKMLEKKDMQIMMAKKKAKSYKSMLFEKEMELKKAMMMIDSLQMYKKYYIHSKHVIGPRVIRRIEEMVKHDGN